ncbi:penicillin-binding protein 2 [Streptomyces clavuligerus]|uniref:peptidoglycan D,D-transpeptidase FtsI family protein n=1 Tax=Streptomyces clavuligerus TaxID=1901 RepID=UPI000810505C|nr:penicillin-binding protein 2 [Streptomyces clavuligerus]ANW20796.1 penicillin-binding protein [Streptomyces clavuligerus]AXU15422.1 penicillin-binding protein 2 [Streptomyces clavuligerus]QPL65419.1 penicillin-binding protein 2 [Streptomyces clavuligerus]QPL71450.1 penicillin-binding protein 2 [Streptomyces clavuligerus]QPL77532.1 penicillin-binding protein 2 [Streptomyces clavuligerus]
MNRTIRHIAVFSLLMVLALLVRATWLQGYQADALADNDRNQRKKIAQYAQPLGDIVVAGAPVTGSTRSESGDLAYQRTYPDGGLYAPVTGYSSQLYGSTQLEGIYSEVLDGIDDRLKNPADALTRKQQEPGTVLTTIDPEVQKAGYRALGDTKGAAVAVDPATGKILSLVSTPSYDPSAIAGMDGADAWQALLADEDKPMVNRAIRQPLPPGSTFKLVVAAAALEEGRYGSVDEPTDSPMPYVLPGTVRELPNDIASAPCENASIRTAMRWSCNNVFAKLAVDLGQDTVRAMAEKFGFNDKELDVPVRAYASVYPSGMDRAQTALTGIGQFDVTATPLQMAMVSAAIANDGVLKAPHMVSEVVDGDGETLESYEDAPAERIMSERTAEQLRSAMVTVVEDGTGSNARVAGAEVGGKTGTAQHGENNARTPYAWFTSYAKDPASGKEVAVAVLIEDAGGPRSEVSGNGLAAPVAQKMMAAALK